MNLESLLERNDIPQDVRQTIRQHISDVTEKKMLKKAVEEFEEKLRSFIDAATDPILLLDSNLNVIDINEIALRGLELNRENALGKPLGEISPDIKGMGRYDKYMEVIKTGKPLLIKDLVPHPKFGDLHIELKAFKVGDGLGLITRDITENKRAEEQLLESEEKFRLLSEQSILGIVILQDGFIKYVNNACAKIIHYTPEEMINWPPNEFVKAIHPEDRSFAIEQARKKQLGESDTVSQYKYRLITKLGEIKWIESYSKTITYEGKPADFINIIDITDRIEAEEALRESEERLRAFMDSATDAFAVWDSDLKLVDINKSGMRMIPEGMERENIIGMNLKDFDITRGKDIYDKYQEVIKTGKPYSIDNTIPHPKFGDIYLNLKAFKVGEGMGMIVTNITKRKRVEKALRESEERLRAFMDSATDYFSLWDSDLNLIDLNRVAKDILQTGSTREELIGKNLSEFDPFKERDVYYNFLRVITTGKPYFAYDYIFQKETEDDTHLSIKAFKVGDGLGMIVTDITQRIRAEEALRDSRDKYQMLIEKLEEGVLLEDADGIITFVNPRALKRLGYLEEEMIGKHWSLTSPPEDLKRYQDETAKRPKGISSTYESGILSRDGKRIPVIVSATPLHSPDGEYIGTLSVFRDISEQKKAELQLRESEEKFRLLSEQGILGIAILQDGLVKYVNEACAEIIGIPQEEMMNWPRDEFGKAIHPDDRPLVLEQARKKQLGEEDVITHYSFRIRTKSGKIKWLENYSKTVLFEGKPADLSTLIDITERKKTEESLKESEQRYRTLITSMSDGIIVNDMDNRIVLINPVLEQMLGYSKEEMQNRSVTEFLDPESIKIYQEKTDDRHSGKIPSDEYELIFVRKDGIKITTRISASVLEEGSQIMGSFAIISDITSKRELEDRRSSFMSMTAHELRTPTTIIKGYTELLESYIRELGLEHSDKFVNPLQRINKNVQRLERLITDVRDIMKIERGVFHLQTETVVFNEFLDEFLGSYQVILKDQLEYSIGLMNEIQVSIECDPERLLQVLGNLIRNAIDNTPKDTRKITVISNLTSEDIIIEISDNGAGIEPKNLQKIFEPFVSVPTEFTVQGTGVGLYLSRSIVEAHGGSLSAFSEGKGLGATFTVRLPKMGLPLKRG